MAAGSVGKKKSARTASARKAARRIERQTDVNKARRSRMKTEVRRVEEAIGGGDRSAALEALKAAAPVLVRTAQQGVIHKKTASRKVSRLVARVKSMAN